LILASPLGVIFGYIMSSTMVKNWQNSHPGAAESENNAWRMAFNV